MGGLGDARVADQVVSGLFFLLDIPRSRDVAVLLCILLLCPMQSVLDRILRSK